MPAHDKDQIATQHFPFGEQISERCGIEREAPGVEKYLRGRGMFGPEIRASLYFAHLSRGKTTRPPDVVRRHRIGMRVFGLPGVIEKDLHSAGTGTSFASRQRRSSE